MRRGKHILSAAVLACVATLAAAPTGAQTLAVEDPVIRQMWRLGMEESHAHRIAQTLMDSIGPRLTGSPGLQAGNEWAQKLLSSWGVEARNEQYGTWRGWRRGITHIDLLQPRVRSLEGMILAWSGNTNGRPVQGSVVLVPPNASDAELAAWLPSAAGKFVLLSAPQPTCRPDRMYNEFGQPGALQRLSATRDSMRNAFRDRVAAPGIMRTRLEAAGAAGIIESNWSGDFGVNKVFSTNTSRIPTIDLSCEDYGLLWRLAENNQGPVIRVTAESEFLGEVPVHNTVGLIRGSEKPDEYIILSAHFDSWDGGSGATDNGTGSTVMLEAMRILKQVYPNPKRSIIIGLWGGEEQGLNGSRRFAAMHPNIVEGLQALFNQDNGTGRVVNISMQGLTGAGALWGDWMTRLPAEITRHIDLTMPGSPSGGGSDNAAFICSGAPGFGLSSTSWSYSMHTWHTNRDTYDKIVMEEIRNNATLVAMLAYLASEDPRRMPRDRRVMPTQGNRQMEWPRCSPGATSSGASNR
jgi:carboxypeptidase Q